MYLVYYVVYIRIDVGSRLYTLFLLIVLAHTNESLDGMSVVDVFQEPMMKDSGQLRDMYVGKLERSMRH